MVIEIGTNFVYHNPVTGENVSYTYTGKTQRRYGTTYYEFVKIKDDDEELNFADFWGLSERYLEKQIEDGIIEPFSTLEEWIEVMSHEAKILY